jgi:hypothetical protein
MLAILTSCNISNNTNTKSLQEILVELNKSKYYNNNDISRIKLEKKVSFINENITLQIANDKISYPREEQTFLTITRYNIGNYTIPILSNTFRNYWNFQNEEPNKFAPRINTTFEIEIKKCFNYLQLSDTNNLDWFLIQRIFRDGIDCRELNSHDINQLGFSFSNYGVETLGEDDFYKFDSLTKRNKRMILENYGKNSSKFYHDDKFNRVYEIHYKNVNWRKDSCDFEIKTYRFEGLKHEIHI